MSYTVAGLLAGYRARTLDPAELLAGFGVDSQAGALASRRWQEGSARALEGVPVVAHDPDARVFAERHGAVAVVGPSAPLALGGSAMDALAVARAGSTALVTPAYPTMACTKADDLAAVLSALGCPSPGSAHRVARIEGLRADTDAARRSDDLALSLLSGLGLEAHTLSLSGSGRLPAAAADADALSLPAAPTLIEEARAARLCALALPGAWNKGDRFAILLAAADALMLARLGARLAVALGSA